MVNIKSVWLLISFLLIGVIFVSGCVQQQTKYVCPDGTTVSDASLCSHKCSTNADCVGQGTNTACDPGTQTCVPFNSPVLCKCGDGICFVACAGGSEADPKSLNYCKADCSNATVYAVQCTSDSACPSGYSCDLSLAHYGYCVKNQGQG